MMRPEFHFTPERGWMNDPNGLVFDGEFYHLFYQSTPGMLVPDFLGMHWGHARSRDLICWEHLPAALAPDELGGVFSGSAVMDSGRMVLIYTYHDSQGVESQAIARSTDSEHIHFEKCAANPVLPNPGAKDFRDPKVFLRDEAGLWHMALACGDHVRFYTSPDLCDWTLKGRYGAHDHAMPGLWECPDLIRLEAPDGGFKWVLIFSLGLPASVGGGKTVYVIGDYRDGAFTPDGPDVQAARKAPIVPGGPLMPDVALSLPVDMGPDCYAGVTFWGVPDNRKIMIAWMNNWSYAVRTPAANWRGQMTCPRELSLVNTWDGLRLAARPIAPESAIRRLPHEGGELLIVRDRYSVETFLPAQGISFTQVLF